jgi:hypothetical protein
MRWQLCVSFVATPQPRVLQAFGRPTLYVLISNEVRCCAGEQRRGAAFVERSTLPPRPCPSCVRLAAAESSIVESCFDM